MSFNTPVLLLIFNRPDVTARVFEEIRTLKPKYLYIAADGPRAYKAGEAEKCKITRQLVLDNIDWDCEKNILFRTENFGCGKSVSTAISWFFDHVEEGIILEDDCLPHPSFFTFCQELLDKYRDNEKIMHIGGSNFLDAGLNLESSYYFTNYIHIWGWATWRRAWKTYRFDLPKKEDLTFLNILKKKFSDKIECGFWKKTFYDMAHYPIDTWDTQWVYSFFQNGGIGITPMKNLISNIGFGADATHTKSFDEGTSVRPVSDIGTIRHPAEIKILQRADRLSYKKLYQFGNTRFNRFKFAIGQKVPAVKRIYLTLAEKAQAKGDNAKKPQDADFKNKFAFLFYRVLFPALLNFLFYFIPRRKQTLLIIKNDGIGDYILFRNYLQELKRSAAYRSHRIFLLGNTNFRELAIHLDSATVDGFYWYNDSFFLKWDLVKLLYRIQRLRPQTIAYVNYSRRFTTDWLVKNIRAANKIGVDGDTLNETIGQKNKTNHYYDELIQPADTPKHEFYRNKQIVESMIAEKIVFKKPSIDASLLNIETHRAVVVFPGGSEPQKRWSVTHYNKFCRLLLNTVEANIILAGSRDDVKDTEMIARGLSAGRLQNKAGTVNLIGLCELIGGAQLLISNDTVAIHIAVALDVPVICIARGDLFGRFIPYPKMIFDKIQTVFPPGFAAQVDYKLWSDLNINDILPEDVYHAAEKVLAGNKLKIN